MSSSTPVHSVSGFLAESGSNIVDSAQFSARRRPYLSRKARDQACVRRPSFGW